MKISTEGLIIKEQNIGEQDKLVTVLTKSHGVIRAFAKNVKNIKRSKCAAVSLLCYSRIDIYQTRESYIISGAEVIDMFIKLRNDIANMSLAQYFCELAYSICPHEQPAEESLSVILNGLFLLAENKKPRLLIKACVETRLLCLCGYMPDLVMCHKCGKYESDGMVFVPQKGILYCDKCYESGKEDYISGYCMDMTVVTALRYMIYSSSKRLFSFMINEERLYLLNEITETFVRCTIGKEFKTLHFYYTINN